MMQKKAGWLIKTIYIYKYELAITIFHLHHTIYLGVSGIIHIRTRKNNGITALTRARWDQSNQNPKI